jgi:hypothetical protein
LSESIALRHQIALLERSRTRRPCFRRFDRLFWILLSRWWSDWRASLVIVQPETVLRWRRNGWSAMWKYRSHGRWRGGLTAEAFERAKLLVRGALDLGPESNSSAVPGVAIRQPDLSEVADRLQRGIRTLRENS